MPMARLRGWRGWRPRERSARPGIITTLGLESVVLASRSAGHERLPLQPRWLRRPLPGRRRRLAARPAPVRRRRRRRASVVVVVSAPSAREQRSVVERACCERPRSFVERSRSWLVHVTVVRVDSLGSSATARSRSPARASTRASTRRYFREIADPAIDTFWQDDGARTIRYNPCVVVAAAATPRPRGRQPPRTVRPTVTRVIASPRRTV